MKLHKLQPAPGSRRKAKRVGRGTGTGLGKTAGRGSNGQLSRSGGGKGPSFEGGQTPLQRRLPKRGFKNPTRKDFAEVKIADLARFPEGTTVTPELLLQERVVRKLRDGVKVLGNGELTAPLTVQAHGFTRSAVEKIEAAGGKVEQIG